MRAELPNVFRQSSCRVYHIPILTPLKLAKNNRVSAVPWKYVISALNCQLHAPRALLNLMQKGAEFSGNFLG